jgi:cytochrome c
LRIPGDDAPRPDGFGAMAVQRHRSTVLEVCPMRLWIMSALIALGAAGSAHAQDVASGEKVFLQCKACHQVGPTAKNAVGPILNGLFGRAAGQVEGYNYSPANKNSGIKWDDATFADYIKDPKAKIPGTKMVFAGVKDEAKVKDLIAYLHQFDSAPVKRQ